MIGLGIVLALLVATYFSGTALERLEQSCIEKVVVTNTLPLRRQIDKMEVVSIAPLIAAAIRGIFEDTSVSEIFGGGNFN